MKQSKKIGIFAIILGMLTFMVIVKPVQGAQQEEGYAAQKVWSGYWWPICKGEILGPLAKYDKLTDKESVAWEKKTHPADKNVPNWFGYCHGWSASAIMETEPLKSIQKNNIELTVGDQKALLTVCHADDVVNIYGKRYTGPQDEKNDITPDELWMVLRRYLRDQQLPIVLDIEPGEQVWNYPVFAYKVSFEADEENNCCFGTMELWFADDNVEPDYVGQQRLYKKYSFKIEMIDGSLNLGTGQWTGDSIKDHPDFAWFPYVVRPENPEIDYQLISELLNVTQDNVPGPQDELLPMTTLVELLKNKTSNWHVDITVDQFDGGQYHVDQPVIISGKSEKMGYLYLLGVGPQANVCFLYPQPGDDNRVYADKEFVVPSNESDYRLIVTKPYGTYRIWAIVSEKPLKIEGMTCDSKHKDVNSPLRSVRIGENEFRLPPTYKQQICEQLSEMYGRNKSTAIPAKEETPHQNEDFVSRIIGKFAQDETAFILVPEQNNVKQKQHEAKQTEK